MVVSGAGDGGLSSYPSTPSTDAPPVALPESSSSRKNSGNSQPEINPLVGYYIVVIGHIESD